jgi:macrolide transport system ATP-binding/permease protein
MHTLKQDVLHGLRLLWKSPAFTIVSALTLALGIGANTAIFSIVSWLLLRPLPVARPMDLVELAFQQRHSGVQKHFSVPDYLEIREQSTAQFEDIAAYQIGIDGLSVEHRAERLMTYYVTGNFFSTLGLKPAAGRLLMPGEGDRAGADPVLVLGYAFWKSRFNGDPSVVGKKVLLNGRPFTTVGVGPEGFHGPYPIIEAQVYVPLGMKVIEGTPADFLQNRGNRNSVLLAELRPGVTLGQAKAAMKVVGQRLSSEHPGSDQDLDLQAYLEVRSRPEPDPNNTMLLLSTMFLGLAGIVLIVACLNIANIVLVRATTREREMAVRAALGATRVRLIRQLLTESLVLALLGGLAGLVFGYAGSRALSSLDFHTDLPLFFDFAFDWRVFAYGFSAALVTGAVVGLVPALRASRRDVNEVLRQGGRSIAGAGARIRTMLVVGQVAGSLTLLVVAGLFGRSLQAAQRTNLGFDPSHVVNFYMDPSELGYGSAQTNAFYNALLDRVRALPGVESATTASSAPMSFYNDTHALIIEGYEPPPGQPRPGSYFEVVGSDYFRTLRIPLQGGRVFTAVDNDARAPYVAIVNQTFAQKYWPKQDPIGRRFRMAGDAAHTITVVGVAANARYAGVTGAIASMFYVPLAQHLDVGSLQALQIRAAGDAAAQIPVVERLIATMAPDLPVFDVKTMTQALDTLNGLMVFQLGAALAAVLGVLGLVLSLIGVYGVISYTVAQRTQEIGVRMALGARPPDILWMVLRHGSLVVTSGLGLGLLCSFGAGRFIRPFLLINPADPLTYSAVSGLLAVVALIACYIPARRSTTVDPIAALRE